MRFNPVLFSDLPLQKALLHILKHQINDGVAGRVSAAIHATP
jgi:hypothetical protein